MNLETTITPEAGRRLAVSDATDTAAVFAELKRQHDAARDYVTPASQLELRHRTTPQDEKTHFTPVLTLPTMVGAKMPFSLNQIAHEQLADRIGIAQHYYRKLRSNAADNGLRVLYEDNVNFWLDRLGDTKLLVRTLDGNVRAIMSNRYFVLDSFDTMMHTANVVLETDNAVLQRLDVTEEKFYARILHVDHAIRLERQADGTRALADSGGAMFGSITDGQGHVSHNAGTAAIVQNDDMHGPNNALSEQFQALALHDDWFVPGVVVKNSEVGRGGLSIEPFIFQTYCTNTAIFGRAFGRIHRSGELDNMLTDETRKKQRDVVFSEIRDVITATFDEQKFRQHIADYLGLQSEELEDAGKAVEQLKKVDSSFTEAEQQMILNRLITQGEGATAWGLVNAVTAYAHQQADADRRAELETIGGRMIEKFPRELITVRR